MTTIRTGSDVETIAFATEFAQVLRGGDVVALCGDLGAGKTQFVKGVAAALGIPGAVSSPTYVIAQHHGGGRLPLVHLDLYRLADAEHEIVDMGWFDWIADGAVLVVEWAEKIPGLLSAARGYRVSIVDAGGSQREITVAGSPMI